MVDAVAGAVIVTLLIVVATAAPRVGVTSVGLVSNTFRPVPVLVLSADKRLAELNELVPNTVAFPVEVIAPVRFALVVTLPAVSPEAVPVILVPTKAVGVPSAGVTNVGLVARTITPVPVGSLIFPTSSALVAVLKSDILKLYVAPKAIRPPLIVIFGFSS